MFKKLGRNDMCWCGSGRKYKLCHMQMDEKILQYKDKGYKIPIRKMIKNQAQLEGIRESGKVNIAVLDYVAEHICSGMPTEDIDQMVAEKTKELGGIAAPLNFEGYPKSVCTSINEEVCHGIPSKDVILQEGDIVNVDVSTIYKDYFSDSSRMFCIGQVSPQKKKLVEDTKKSIEVGLSFVKPWHRIGELGNAIHEFARENGYSVVREIGGHGVGIEFHEDPFVSFVCPKNSGVLLVPGMVFTIEPMINLGRSDIVMDDENGWTVYTEDGMPSAQWEVTVAVTDEGYEIMAY
ncbi:MAG: methionyl aminopeptidase [Lachnospiraceae bacterium]|nr:methionyl aminopeptidase [Lachnospiraceae bacterium]